MVADLHGMYDYKDLKMEVVKNQPPPSYMTEVGPSATAGALRGGNYMEGVKSRHPSNFVNGMEPTCGGGLMEDYKERIIDRKQLPSFQVRFL